MVTKPKSRKPAPSGDTLAIDLTDTQEGAQEAPQAPEAPEEPEASSTRRRGPRLTFKGPDQRRNSLAFFSDRLAELMTRDGVTQSDVAKHLWGTEKNERGNIVARGRDRMSLYASGKKHPDAENVRKLAAFFGVEPATMVAPPPPAVKPGTFKEFRTVPGEPGKVALQLDVVISESSLWEIMAILKKEGI